MLKKIEPQNGQVLSAKPLPSSPAALLLPQDAGQDIRDELETILASDFFRGSKRCQSFLRFVVEAALSGDGERLKERILGIELFDRDPAYDTGEDAIVRVKANEVRRRLAQYAQQLTQIELFVSNCRPVPTSPGFNDRSRSCRRVLDRATGLEHGPRWPRLCC